MKDNVIYIRLAAKVGNSVAEIPIAVPRDITDEDFLKIFKGVREKLFEPQEQKKPIIEIA